MARPPCAGPAAGGPSRPVTEVEVEARLATGGLKATWQGVMVEGPGWWCVAAIWTRRPTQAGPLTFAPGDRLLEVYWADRWYNVFRVAAPEPAGRLRRGARRLKGYYVNLATPARLAEAGTAACRRPPAGAGRPRLVYVDGVLDAVVLPDGRWRWLDRAEFRHLLGLGGRGRGTARCGSATAGAGPDAGAGGPARSAGAGPDEATGTVDRAAWIAAARRLAVRLARDAQAFVAGLVPWDDLERALDGAGTVPVAPGADHRQPGTAGRERAPG
ncbi:DUF402 domain-containing protein [Thermaerobacter sp. FW80]|uniref:DUF402 domain-containing protein n=1 Tax=Thermaerobacter sp. FW80 TaxID=2546351 RepID=UPI001430A4B9|nr:DUF402 domain-containing protein [Thermaerobacter sp. FW80]